MNIIIIIVDALRPDHLKINSYFRDTSPNIDNLAKYGTSFSNCYTSLTRTDPSVTSILTGLFPHNHGIRMVDNARISPNISSLPQILKHHGYKTAYIGEHVHKYGIEEGFDDFLRTSWNVRNKIKKNLYKIINPKEKIGPAYQYTDTTINWIKKNIKNKFFVCLHYNELHWPYHSPFENIFDKEYPGKHDFNTLGDGKFTRGDIIFGNVKLPEGEVEHAIAHYDGNLKYIDSQIERLLEFLEKKKLLDDTLIVLTSDHGENFGEHGFYFQHGASLYQPSLRTPLILKNEKIIPKGKKIESNVQLVDIMPTVLDILNIHVLDKIDGASLVPIIKTQTEKARDFVFAESIEEHFDGNKRVFIKGIKGKWRTMIIGDWKIIYIPHPQEDIFELYDIKKDPHENNNLIDKEKEIASTMKKKILDFLSLQSNEGDADISDLTEKSKKLLRKLGYIN